MARSLGVKVPPMGAVAMEGFEGMGLVFNWLSIIIDIAPLFVLFITSDWRDARKYFTEKCFALGAVMNLFIMAHVLFCAKEPHPDVLLVSAVGFFLGTAYTFFLLAHRVVTADEEDKAFRARCWMLLVLFCFLIACLLLLTGIQLKYKSNCYYIIAGLLLVSVLTLNGFTLHPIITCKGFPDQEARLHNWCMCILNLIDSSFFVVYAMEVKSSDVVLSLVSMINAGCGCVQLIALALIVIVRCFRKLGAYCRSWGGSCCGACRLASTLFDLFGRERTD